jgi:hypothetical protein
MRSSQSHSTGFLRICDIRLKPSICMAGPFAGFRIVQFVALARRVVTVGAGDVAAPASVVVAVLSSARDASGATAHLVAVSVLRGGLSGGGNTGTALAPPLFSNYADLLPNVSPDYGRDQETVRGKNQTG